ncbi:MAG: sortase [Bacteroidales bacterium]|nr:sortase [Lachnoclostridium sp.]MCM1383836.1 sortase [Lachnoclostridium sp.]MCM1464511.1 sortase [Bacteroidales bacterium]
MDNTVDNNSRKEKLITALTVIIFICLACAGILSAKEYLARRQTEEPISQAQSEAESTVTSPTTMPSEPLETIPSESSSEPDASLAQDSPAPPQTVPNPYADSYLANEDMAAWLLIPGTNVDYPVMWTPRDEEYYLRRGFDGKSDNNGCLILDTDSCLDPLTTNLIIHGHNMRSGAMFGKLADYEKEDFYKEHKQMSLYTEKCLRNYEVIAVFRSQVYRQSDQVFKFYKFFQADTQEEFDDFYQNIMALSLYDTGVTAQFGDHFLTLSTCSYHSETGRFVVVAKEVETGDYYDPIYRENDQTTHKEVNS